MSPCELSSPMHSYLVWVSYSVSGGELQEKTFHKVILALPRWERGTGRRRSMGLTYRIANHVPRYQETKEPPIYRSWLRVYACACVYHNPLQGSKDKVILGFKFFKFCFCFKRTLLDCNPRPPFLLFALIQVFCHCLLNSDRENWATPYPLSRMQKLSLQDI